MSVTSFAIAVADEEIDDLGRRLAATRWPRPAPGLPWDHGTDLAYLQQLVHYWRHGFDWRAQEREHQCVHSLPRGGRRRASSFRPRARADRTRDSADPHPRLAEHIRRVPAARAAAHRPCRAWHRRPRFRPRSPLAAGVRLLGAPAAPSHVSRCRYDRVHVPTAVAQFAHMLVPEGEAPREWAERLYDVKRWTPMPRGGHFATAEEPRLVAADIAAFFAST